MRISTQEWVRAGRAPRWSYVLEDDDGWIVWVSDYRYHSQASAHRAAEADLASTGDMA